MIERAPVLEIPCVCLQYKVCDYQQRSGKRMMELQFKEVRRVRMSTASDHAVADCILFCVLLATSANPQGGG